jgi:hypothetical protein
MVNVNESKLNTRRRPLSIKDSIRLFLKHWNGVSGFNTVKSYENLSQPLFRRDRDNDNSALLAGIEILNQYLDDLMKISPESGNHDIQLKTQLAMKRTEVYPLLPASFSSAPYETQSRLFVLYRLLMDIHEDLMNLQNLFQIMDGYLPFLDIIRSEKVIIEAIKESIRNICQSGSVGSFKPVADEILTKFREVTDLSNYRDLMLQFLPENKQILEILEHINDSNQSINSVFLAFDTQR